MLKFYLLKIAAIALVLGGSFYSCKEEEETEWREISFRDYSLADTYCQWSNLNYDGKIIIINSQNDLKKYITCTEGSYPEIDFSQNNLLLVSGGIGGGVGTLSAKLLKKNTNKFVLEVKIVLNDTAIAWDIWRIALVTNKLSSKDKIELDVKTEKN